MSLGLRIAAFKVFGDRLGVLPDALEFTWTTPLGDIPTLTLSYTVAGRQYPLLEGHVELAVEMFDPVTSAWVEPPGARFHVIKRSWNRTDAAPVRQYECQGVQWTTRRARVWDSAGNMDTDGKRQFLSATPGKIIGTLFTEAQARGWSPGLSRTFTDLADSAGQPWAKVLTIAYDPGLDLDAVITNLYDQGVLDYRWQGRALAAYNPDTALGPDLTVGLAPVWVRDDDVTGAPETGTIEDLVTFARVAGEDGVTWEIDNPSALQTFGRLEAYITQGGVSDEGTARTLADAELRKGEDVRFQYTREIDTAMDRPWPHVDYPVGAWVFTTTDQGVERVRVMSVSLTMNMSGTTGHLTLGTRLDDLLARLAKRTKGILGGSTADGGSGSRPNPPGDDKRVPVAPQGLVVETSAYIDGNGDPAGLATFGWGEVTHATDGTVIDSGIRYEVQGRQAVAGVPWQGIASTEDTTTAYSPLPVGQEWAFRVRAVAEPGYRAGAWSTVVQVTIADDTTAPPAPSPPILTSRLGTVSVQWDGKTHNGAQMPPDFNRVDVWCAQAVAPVVDVNQFIDPRMTSLANMETAHVAIAATLITDFPTWGTAVRATRVATGNTRLGFIMGTAMKRAQAYTVNMVVLASSALNAVTVNARPTLSSSGNSVVVGTVNIPANVPTVISVSGMTADVAMSASAGFSLIWAGGAVGATLDVTRVTVIEGSPSTGGVIDGSQETTTEYAYGWDGTVDASTSRRTLVAGAPIAALRITGGSDTAVIADLPYGRPLQFWFTAVDRAGNVSEPSAISVIATEPLVDADLIGQVIDGAHIVNGTVVASDKVVANTITGALIQALAVTADKIAANAITADKIAAGAVTAEKITATAIDGKTITGATIQTAASGARTLLSNPGVQAFNAAGQELVRLGHGLTYGLAVRNPNTGVLTELAAVAFGMRYATNDTFWDTGVPNAGFAADPRVDFTFTAATNRALVITWFTAAMNGMDVGGPAVSVSHHTNYTRVSNGSLVQRLHRFSVWANGSLDSRSFVDVFTLVAGQDYRIQHDMGGTPAGWNVHLYSTAVTVAILPL